MRRFAFALTACLMIAFNSGTMTATRTEAAQLSIADRLTALQKAYPDQIERIAANAVVMKDGTRFVIDDGLAKSHQAKLLNADIEDMLSLIYPIGTCATKLPPSRNHDPGRIRVTKFFQHMYGQNAEAAARNLVTINWFGRRLRATRVNGVASSLAAVHDELARLPEKYRKYLSPSAGAFNWRVIAGTKTLSVHSFGAAIDINIKHANYWRWSGDRPGSVNGYRNQIPQEIVQVFERHGFIWGGRWYHYDTMHFEYRPELIRIGRMHEANGCR